MQQLGLELAQPRLARAQRRLGAQPLPHHGQVAGDRTEEGEVPLGQAVAPAGAEGQRAEQPVPGREQREAGVGADAEVLDRPHRRVA